jgi:hypothetical protein
MKRALYLLPVGMLSYLTTFVKGAIFIVYKELEKLSNRLGDVFRLREIHARMAERHPLKARIP